MYFDPNSVGIVASTYFPKWYRGKLRSIKHTDKIRGDLVLESAGRSEKLGYRMVLVDAGSSKTFVKDISAINGILVAKRRSKKRSPSKRAGIKILSSLTGIKAIVITEGEKVSLISDCISQIVEPVISGTADIVIPKREQSLFKSSYPEYMFESETEGNRLYNEILKENNLLNSKSENLDMFFGPRAFRNERKIVSIFMKKYSILSSEYFDSEEWSDAQFFPIVLALKKKFEVKSVTIPFSYPRRQKENEEACAKDIFVEKRRAQKMGLIIELLRFINYIKVR
jgi:hypothetical protein